MVFAGLAVITTLVIAGPASAKVDIEKVNIIGPGLDGGLHIKAPDTRGLWGSGIDLSDGTDIDLSDGIDTDMSDGTDDMRAGSVEELGLAPADLGPRYLVTYRFTFSDALIRQDLFPYAKGGPVTYTPSGQKLTVQDKAPAFLRDKSIFAGWYQSTPVFLDYLIVDHGFPETSPVAAVVHREPDAALGFRIAPWAGIVALVVGLSALLPRLRRRSVARA